MKRQKKLHVAGWAAAGIALTLLFRLVPLSSNVVWFDELYSIKLATFPLERIAYLIRFDTHPPLYYQLLRGMLYFGNLLGEPFISIDWLRASSIAPSVATCFLIAYWVRRLRGRTAGWFALTVAALTPGLCFYAQELRNYALVMMFIIFSSMNLSFMLRRPTWMSWFGFSIGAVGAFYSHNLSIVILFGFALWTWFSLFVMNRPADLKSRLNIYSAFLLIGTLYIFQLDRIYLQFYEQYKPIEDLLGQLSWPELFTVFIYDFPAGPLHTEAWHTPYGIFAGYVFGGLGLLLLFHLFRGHRPFPRRLSAAASFWLCIFLMGFYLSFTWGATILGFGVFFSSHRLAMLVLPLWVVSVAMLIEQVKHGQTRQRARLILIAAMLPCAVLSLAERSRLRSDFGILSRRLKEAGKSTQVAAQIFYVPDTAIVPWIADPHDSIHLEPMEKLLNEDPLPQFNLEVLTLNSIDERLETDRDQIMDVWLNRWAEQHETPIEYHGQVKRYIIPAYEVEAFVYGMKRALAVFENQVVRKKRRLVLWPYCWEFNNAVGFYPPEMTDDEIFRWTDGPQQRLYWRAPEQPGRYRIRVHFWRPHPFPTERTEVQYRVNSFPFRHANRSGAGSIVLESDVQIERPRQPMEMQILTDPWQPLFFAEDSLDGRNLSLMFLKLEMLPVDEPAE